MTEIRVAVPGASGWMRRAHTIALRTFPQILGTADGRARIVALVVTDPAAKPAADPDLQARAPGRKDPVRGAHGRG